MIKKPKGDSSPCRATMCSTCPFRHGSKYAHLLLMLSKSATTENSRVCHSTGSNAINKSTGKKPHLCRGARDVQLKFFHTLKVIAAPTDEAWNNARAKIGMSQTIIKDP